MIMRRILYLLFALFLCGSVSSFAQGTEKPRVAIYTEDDSGENIVEFVGQYLVNAIVKMGQYTAVERTADFLKGINKEQQYQRTGVVEDELIARLGKQFGARFVCMVKIGKSAGQLFISARLIDVETTAVTASTVPIVLNSMGLNDVGASCQKVVASMFGGKSVGAGFASTSSSIGRSHPAEPEMVFVEGGTFLMGCTSEQGGDCFANESPNHLVTVSDFYISKYEITQGQWEAIMGTSIRQQRDKALLDWQRKHPNWAPLDLSINGEGSNYPMYYVSWNDVQEFISRLNSLTGKQYRLPTEAEWEYAARGGKKSKGYKYSGSNDMDAVAWYSDNSGNTTHPVGDKQPNELGIYDMSGNVYEWCYDWNGDYNSGSHQTNPKGSGSGSYRVIRGGCWNRTARFGRVSARNNSAPSNRTDDRLGFRLVCPK